MTKPKQDKFKQELAEMLSKLKESTRGFKGSIPKEKLKPVYTLIHNIDNTAQILGMNSISSLFTPIEALLSEAVNNSEPISHRIVELIASIIEISDEVLDDPSLKNSGLKVNFENLKKLVVETVEEKRKNEEQEESFSNSRFQDVFFEEAQDLINQLEEKLLQLESETNDSDLIDSVFRIMHTLKGNSNMFGFEHLGEVTHHLENLYDEIRGQRLEINRNILDITLQCTDHFRNLIEDPDLSEQGNKEVQTSILNDIGSALGTKNPPHKDTKTQAVQKETDENVISYYLFFKPGNEIFNDGTNPLYFVYDLHEIGNCNIVPVIEMPSPLDTYNPEICYTAWHILISTDKGATAISDNFIFLKDEDQPDIQSIKDGNLLSDNAFVKHFNDLAKSKHSIFKKLFYKKNQSQGVIKKKEKAEKARTNDNSIASIRVASSKIDLMMNLISELVTKQAELSMLATENDNSQLQELAERIESISRDLRDNAFSISLIPLEKSVLRFQRLVRDVSSKFNKLVDFVVVGKETELDKTIIEKIVDPIMHILRNSIDHGIETPEKRRQLGKPEYGTITLKAYPSGAHVVIEIKDDGSGINVDMVKKVAVRKGYVKEYEDFTTEDMLKLILQPGFSTTENVSEVSGRGVGMDVVNQKILEIRGELEVDTEANVGTTITIRLPLTISIIDSLLVTLGGTYYLIPLSVVERCAEVPTHVITEATKRYLNLEGEFIPFIDLHNEFELEGEREGYQRLILVNHKNYSVALVVDEILGNHQAVLKSLGQAYRKHEIISGASILGNGEVALVIDTNKLVNYYMANRMEELDKINLLNSQAKEMVE